MASWTYFAVTDGSYFFTGICVGYSKDGSNQKEKNV
jgi:hypothetical protein